MKRFVVRFTGNDEPPPEDLDRIRALPESKVIDSSPRMLLMEAPDAALAELVRSIPSWSVSPEEFTPLPDPRPKIRR
jgi:hypothetical protein